MCSIAISPITTDAKAPYWLTLHAKSIRTGVTAVGGTFVDIEAWGKQAELVAKYLTKGAPALIEGRLRLDEWTDKTSGQKRSRLKVVLENVQFLGGKRDGTPAEMREGEQRQEQQPRATTQASNAIPGDGEDVPF